MLLLPHLQGVHGGQGLPAGRIGDKNLRRAMIVVQEGDNIICPDCARKNMNAEDEQED